MPSRNSGRYSHQGLEPLHLWSRLSSSYRPIDFVTLIGYSIGCKPGSECLLSSGCLIGRSHMTGGATPSPPSEIITEQAALWWHETDSALQSGQIARARRYLRWILACCPEDVEAWLWFARLTPNLDERLGFLRRGYILHPDSRRLRYAMRQAREEQLAREVHELKPWQARVRCLPDDRRPQSGNGKDRNGRFWNRFGRGARNGSGKNSA